MGGAPFTHVAVAGHFRHTPVKGLELYSTFGMQGVHAPGRPAPLSMSSMSTDPSGHAVWFLDARGTCHGAVCISRPESTSVPER